MTHHGLLTRMRWSPPRVAVLLVMAVSLGVLVLPGLADVFLVRLFRILDLIPVRFQALAPDAQEEPGSGIAVRTEVAALWIPRELRELAEDDPGWLLSSSPAALGAALNGRGLNHAWYALTYRHFRVDGGSSEVTQLRRLSEMPAQIEELRVVLSALPVRAPRLRGREAAHAQIHLIPESLRDCDPYSGFAQLDGRRARRPGFNAAARTPPGPGAAWGNRRRAPPSR